MEFQKDIENSLQVLQSGGLILYPTDTVWGIGCDATDPVAVKKVFDLKQRSETKSLIVLLADEKDLLRYVSQADLRIFDFLHKAKKPTTMLYEGAIGLAQNLSGTEGTIAIRLVKEDFCKHLIKRFRKPLVSTSANISGEQTPRFFAEISQEIRQGVDYIVQYRQGDHTVKDPSAVIKWNRDGTHTVIRP